MIEKLKRIYGYIITGQSFGIMYEKIFVNAIPRIAGFLSLGLYRFIYPGFKVGAGARCWGNIIVKKMHKSVVKIGDNAHIVSDSLRAGITCFTKLKITAFFNSRIMIGDNVALGGAGITCRTTSIEIMDGAIIAPIGF